MFCGSTPAARQRCTRAEVLMPQFTAASQSGEGYLKTLDICDTVGKTAPLHGAAADSQNRITPMLDAMRRGVANILAKILLGLLVIAFAYWGIGNYDIFHRGG